MIPTPPSFTLFPYTTLFRSRDQARAQRRARPGPGAPGRRQGLRRRGDADAYLKVLALEATDFRNLAQVLVEPHPRFNVLSGDKDRKSTRLNSSHQIISYAVF